MTQPPPFRPSTSQSAKLRVSSPMVYCHGFPTTRASLQPGAKVNLLSLMVLLARHLVTETRKGANTYMILFTEYLIGTISVNIKCMMVLCTYKRGAVNGSRKGQRRPYYGVVKELKISDMGSSLDRKKKSICVLHYAEATCISLSP